MTMAWHAIAREVCIAQQTMRPTKKKKSARIASVKAARVTAAKRAAKTGSPRKAADKVKATPTKGGKGVKGANAQVGVRAKARPAVEVSARRKSVVAPVKRMVKSDKKQNVSARKQPVIQRATLRTRPNGAEPVERALAGLDVDDQPLAEDTTSGKLPPFKERGGFSRFAHAANETPDPKPGQTSDKGNTHDRPGSQLERVRHLYPNGNRPNSGSARSTQAKGKRRDNMSQGG